MGALELKAREFAEKHGLTHVRFHKKWHKYDVYTAMNVKEGNSEIYFLLDDDEIRMATPFESERFKEGHNVRNDLP